MGTAGVAQGVAQVNTLHTRNTINNYTCNVNTNENHLKLVYKYSFMTVICRINYLRSRIYSDN